MIAGRVHNSEAIIRLTIRGLKGRDRIIDAVIDTGYTSRLTLPPLLIRQLGLRRIGSGLCELADGSQREFATYEANIIWDGILRRIRIDESDTTPLVGMKLLTGYELNIQVRERGIVSITRLP